MNSQRIENIAAAEEYLNRIPRFSKVKHDMSDLRTMLRMLDAEFALIIYAGLDGMLNELPLSGSSINDMTLDGSEKFLSYEQLPGNFLEACETSASSDFIKEHIPSDIISIYCGE